MADNQEQEKPVKFLNEGFDLAAEQGKLHEDIQTAIASGDVIATLDSVKTEIRGEVYGRHYVRLVPTTLQGALALVGGVESNWNPETQAFDRGPSVLKDFFYANDQRARANEGNSIRSAVVDPEKAMDKAVKAYAVAMGMSEAEAREVIETAKASRQAK